MSTNRKGLRVGVLCLALLVGEGLSAQEPSPSASSEASRPAESDASRSQSRQPPAADRIDETSRDPTKPPAGILDRIPTPVPAVEPAPTTRTPTKPSVIAALPKLPKITLRAIVLSTPEQGRAMLDVDGTSVSVSLLKRERQLRIPIPGVQFAHLKTALDQRAAAAAPKGGSDVAPTAPKTYEMSLRCSFTVEETIFNVEAFAPDAVLLRAIPHETVILVRRASR
ncbi:MAG: hypothetical protein AAFU85_23730 [Planctomycetota bacterium]